MYKPGDIVRYGGDYKAKLVSRDSDGLWQVRAQFSTGEWADDQIWESDFEGLWTEDEPKKTETDETR